MTEIDAIVGVVVFVVVVSWAFVYYAQIMQANTGTDPMEGIADRASDRLVGYLSVPAYEMPVKHVSAGNVLGAVFWLDYAWPSAAARNSTMVYKGSTRISGSDCNITGSRLYWKSNADAGANNFKVVYYERNATMNCTGGGLGSPVNRTLPWAAVRTSRLSQSRISTMAGMDYESFKAALDLGRDFRVQVNASGYVTTYGPPTPNSTSVYEKTTSAATEAGNSAEVMVWVW